MGVDSGTMIKGATLIARLEFVDGRPGSGGREAVFARLDPDDRKIIEKNLLPSAMYPLELNSRLDEAVAQILNPRNPVTVYRQLGRASAQRNLRSIHSAFLKGEGPHDVLSRFPRIRTTYYSDGTATYERVDDRCAVIRLTGASGHSRADCESTAGYFERAIELIGGRGPSVMLTRCRARGHRHCEFRCRWK